MHVATSDPDKAPFFSVDPQVTVATGAATPTSITFPTVTAPVLSKDLTNPKTISFP